MNTIRKVVTSLVMLIGVLVPLIAIGQSNLLVTPTRIEFSEKKRFEVLSVTNIGQNSATYRLAFIHYRMNDDGSLVPIDTPKVGDHFADSLVRFFPRQVTLGPGMSQTVRMQLATPDHLPAGEYRSHIVFKNIGVRSSDPNERLPSEAVQVSIKAICSIAIPVIIRYNVTEPQISIGDVFLKQNASRAELKFKILRKGEASAYGDIAVLGRNSNGKNIILNLTKGIGLYTPNIFRECSVPLDSIPEGVSNFTVEFRSHGKSNVLAEATIPTSISAH
jgi:hypothetical protein